MEENREVFAIPGSIHQPQSKGCHQLIKEGATLVESTIDIRTALSGWIETTDHHLQSDLFQTQQYEKESLLNQGRKVAKKSPQIIPVQINSSPKLKAATLAKDHPQYALYQQLSTPKSINQLVEIMQLEASHITTDLMMLEIEDLITADQGFYQQKLS